ncbi:MAG: glutamine synthetase family protein [Porcipelethomonas sp.]
MNYTPREILSFVEENDVKFIRLTFTDIYGNLKNIAIMPGELPRAFEQGIPFDASPFSRQHSDLLLFPDISTLSVLPWRPKSGRVIRFFCNIKCTDGSDYKGDLRKELSSFLDKITEKKYSCKLSTKCEFYLFNTDDNGEPTRIPHDNAGYLDIAPLDKCENARREICLSLEEMGFNPQSSRHTHGPGQNEIDFNRSDPLTAADNMVYYKTVVKNVAAQNGLFASFMPKPMENQWGSGLHIGISIRKDGEHIFSSEQDDMPAMGKRFIAGVLARIKEITCFLNPLTNSYKRLSGKNAPKIIDWAYDNHSQIIRVPYADKSSPRIEIRCADAACNPYIAFKLILAAGIEGIEKGTLPGKNNPSDTLPKTLEEAAETARQSSFVRENLSKEIYSAVFGHFDETLTRYGLSDNKAKFEEEYYFKLI